jgi:hypothetical protein
VNEVASAVAFISDTALGIVPSGSGNGLAFKLGISRRPSAALAGALAGEMRSIDVGELAGRLFVNVAGIGFDAHIAKEVARRQRNPDWRGSERRCRAWGGAVDAEPPWTPRGVILKSSRVVAVTVHVAAVPTSDQNDTPVWASSASVNTAPNIWSIPSTNLAISIHRITRPADVCVKKKTARSHRDGSGPCRAPVTSRR